MDPRHGTFPRIQIGPFWTTQLVPEKQQEALREVRRAYMDPEVRRGLAEMISEEHIALKLYDWFLSHYIVDHRVARKVTDEDGTTAVLDIYNAYLRERWTYRKRYWDFFPKRIKFAFEVPAAAAAEGTSAVVDPGSAVVDVLDADNSKASPGSAAVNTAPTTHLASISQMNAYLFCRKFGIRELIMDCLDSLERHYEQGKAEAEQAAIQSAREAARKAGLSEDAPLKRKRGRRPKPKLDPFTSPPAEPVLISESSVVTRMSLQDG